MKDIDGKDMNDLSKTLEKVKKGLECCSKNVLDPCIGCPYERIGDEEWKCGLNADALAYIQQLEAQVPKWISVEESMPEDYISVIGYLPIDSKNGFPPTREVFHTDRGWYVPALCELRIVTHWMPLPEAPKEEGK